MKIIHGRVFSVKDPETIRVYVTGPGHPNRNNIGSFEMVQLRRNSHKSGENRDLHDSTYELLDRKVMIRVLGRNESGSIIGELAERPEE